MKNRKWQRILSWVLTLTMLLGTFESNILAVNAMDDEVVEAEIEDVEAVDAETDGDVDAVEGLSDALHITRHHDTTRQLALRDEFNVGTDGTE